MDNGHGREISIPQLDDDKERLPKWPQLLFEVVSLDWYAPKDKWMYHFPQWKVYLDFRWGRQRVEGYGHTSLPTEPGTCRCRHYKPLA